MADRPCVLFFSSLADKHEHERASDGQVRANRTRKMRTLHEYVKMT